MNQKTQYTLGIDIGSTTVKIAILSEDGDVIFSNSEDIMRIFRRPFPIFSEEPSTNSAQYSSPVITGPGGLTLAKNLGIPFVQEVIAIFYCAAGLCTSDRCRHWSWVERMPRSSILKAVMLNSGWTAYVPEEPDLLSIRWLLFCRQTLPG